MKRLFKEIVIWETVDDNLVIRYRCFEDLAKNKFFVASSNYFYENFDEKQWNEFDLSFYESVSKENLESLAKESSDTIEKAIKKHNEDFNEVYNEFEELNNFKS